jgi:DNA-binding MarR family transcriptional regulator
MYVKQEAGSGTVERQRKQGTLSADEEYVLWTLLGQVNDGMLRARDNELKQFGISTVQVAILYAVKNLGGSPTPSEISQWVFRKPHTVSAALDRMERHGLVRLIRNKKGKRQVKVAMTPKGEEVYRLQHGKRRVIPAILGSLAPEEREQLRTLLDRLRRKTFDELGPRPSFP